MLTCSMCFCRPWVSASLLVTHFPREAAGASLCQALCLSEAFHLPTLKLSKVIKTSTLLDSDAR